MFKLRRQLREEEKARIKGEREARIKNESNNFGNQVFEYSERTKRVERYPGKIRSKDMSKDDRFLGWL